MTEVVRRHRDTGTATGSPGGRSVPTARPWRRPEIALPAIAAGASWLPFVSRPPSPDEGGFLLVASQWSPGTSLYGDYWVDRPPLLIAIFDVADRLGGVVALRLLGIGVVVVSVLLAGRLADHVTGAGARAPTRWPALLAAVTAAAFLSTPLFVTAEVNGELLAVPFVLGGIVAFVRAHESGGLRSPAVWAVVAGALGAAAALVKQNEIDVVVFATVCTAQQVLGRHQAAAWRRGVEFALAAAGATCLTVVAAALRGTRPTALWDAVVTFGLDAVPVLRSSSDLAAPGRLHALLVALLLSGAPVVVAACAWRLRSPAEGPGLDLRWPALAVTAWELVAVLAGGSYWLHYLTGMVPGLVLLVVAASQRPRSRSGSVVLAAVAGTAVSAALAVVWFDTDVPARHVDAAVASYLRDHSIPGDSVVVGFGHPDIVEASGLTSPYPDLWSLPVRVRDPELTALSTVLDGPAPPTWVVVDGSSLATWGVDADAAQARLDRRYHLVTRIGDYGVYRDNLAP